MSINTVDLGDLITITGRFKNSSGVLTDPTAVYFDFTDPNGSKTTYTYGDDAQIVRSSTGVYYVNLDCDTAGKWYVRFYSTGTGQAALEEYFWVNPTNQ